MKTLKSENNEAQEGGKAGEESSSEAVAEASGFFTPNEKIDFTESHDGDRLLRHAPVRGEREKR